MLRPLVILAAICSAHSSGVGVAPIGPVAPSPVVTAASSQYFERTFNRLVAAPPQPLQPVIPIAPPPPPIFIQAAPNVLPVAPAPPQVLPPQVIPTPPQVIPPPPQVIPQADPNQPNVAIAVATAHAAPVATILLPPYPFGPPPVFGFAPSEPTATTPEEKPREQTTASTITTEAEVTTKMEPEATTPEPSNSDNNFIQALPSNENVNFNKVYGPPLPQQPWPQIRNQAQSPPPRQPFPPQAFIPPYKLPLPTNTAPQGHLPPNQQVASWSQKPQQFPINFWPQKGRPQKLKTSVEVVKVPLAYIAPPPLHAHEHIKVLKHVHGFAPSKKKFIIHTIRTPGQIVTYRIPVSTKTTRLYNIRSKNIELTTHRTLPPTNYGVPNV